jgi:hypothetical protein
MLHGIEVGVHDPPSLLESDKQAANQTARILAKTGDRVACTTRSVAQPWDILSVYQHYGTSTTGSKIPGHIARIAGLAW